MDPKFYNIRMLPGKKDLPNKSTKIINPWLLKIIDETDWTEKRKEASLAEML